MNASEQIKIWEREAMHAENAKGVRAEAFAHHGDRAKIRQVFRGSAWEGDAVIFDGVEVYRSDFDYDRHAHVFPVWDRPSVWRRFRDGSTVEEAEAAFYVD